MSRGLEGRDWHTIAQAEEADALNAAQQNTDQLLQELRSYGLAYDLALRSHAYAVSEVVDIVGSSPPAATERYATERDDDQMNAWRVGLVGRVPVVSELCVVTNPADRRGYRLSDQVFLGATGGLEEDFKVKGITRVDYPMVTSEIEIPGFTEVQRGGKRYWFDPQQGEVTEFPAIPGFDKEAEAKQLQDAAAQDVWQHRRESFAAAERLDHTAAPHAGESYGKYQYDPDIARAAGVLLQTVRAASRDPEMAANLARFMVSPSAARVLGYAATGGQVYFAANDAYLIAANRLSWIKDNLLSFRAEAAARSLISAPAHMRTFLTEVGTQVATAWQFVDNIHRQTAPMGVDYNGDIWTFANQAS